LTVARPELGLTIIEVRLRCRRDECLINLRVDFVLGQLVEDLQLLGLKEFDGGRFDERFVLFQKPVEPVKCVDAKFLGVRMWSLGDLQTEVLTSSVEFVNPPRLFVKSTTPSSGKMRSLSELEISSGRGATRAATCAKSQPYELTMNMQSQWPSTVPSTT